MCLIKFSNINVNLGFYNQGYSIILFFLILVYGQKAKRRGKIQNLIIIWIEIIDNLIVQNTEISVIRFNKKQLVKRLIEILHVSLLLPNKSEELKHREYMNQKDNKKDVFKHKILYHQRNISVFHLKLLHFFN